MRFFWFLSIVLIAVALLHNLGVYGGWYIRFPLLDFFLHFLGGLWVGGISVLVLQKNQWIQNKVALFTAIFVIVLSVGIGWEIFEVAIDATLVSYDRYVFDTFTDLIADSLGALIAPMMYLMVPRFVV